MHDELTKVDIQKMKAELEECRNKLPKLRDDVKTAKGFGDLSENDEYRQAKREINAVRSRIRYFENMIKTAKVIDTKSVEGVVGLFDFITIQYPEKGVPESEWETREIRIVTTLRNDVFNDCISKESPVGKALLGKYEGETVTVHVNDTTAYPIKIVIIKKGKDDENLPISSY